MRAGAAALAAAVAAVLVPVAHAQGLAQLPSALTRLDAKVPLGEARAIFQLPPRARVTARTVVTASVTASGEAVSVRARQRLTLTGTGDYFFVVAAPLHDVRAGPGSGAEPGLRRTGIVWQGFADRRRVLVADADLVPAGAAAALPLRLELQASVDGRPLTGDDPQSGRLTLTLRLRNTTGVLTNAFSAKTSRAGLERILDQVEASVARGRVPEDHVVRISGPARPRPVLVDAPLRVRGEVRLPASSLSAVAVRGATVERRAGTVILRFTRLLGGPAPRATVVSLSGEVRDATAPSAALSADPEPVLPELERARRPRAPEELLFLAGRSLLRVARVRQYEEYLSNPLPGGPSTTLYRFRTVEAASPAAVQAGGDDGVDVLRWLVAGATVLLGAGLAVLWAHS